MAYKLKMGAEYDALEADAEIEAGDAKSEEAAFIAAAAGSGVEPAAAAEH